MATQPERSQRRLRILELRAQGLKIRQIAERTGYSIQHVKNTLGAARKRHAELVSA